MAGPVRHGLIGKSREAALTAVQTYNNPLIRFKSETFIVLMTIAWTYFLHAYFAREGVDYRYLDDDPTSRRKFKRTRDGGFKWWELSTCLKAEKCPLDRPTSLNLEFLIGLRNEIEHHRPPDLDDHLSGRYLACALNYEYWLVQMFGDRYSLGETVAMALHFRDIAPVDAKVSARLPSRIASYIERFEGDMTQDEFDSPRFAYRLIFQRKLANHKGQADRAIQFMGSSDPGAAAVQRENWVIQEKESPKFRRKRVLELVKEHGFDFFGPSEHTDLWHTMDAKNPALGFGVDVEGQWYWYQRWVDAVLEHCRSIAVEKARPVSPKRERR